MNDIKKNMLLNEEHLCEYATKDKDAIRLFGNLANDIRPNYFRDIDRIIYSLSYTRYMDKTQVYTHKNNDNIQKRIIHVQLVSKIARTIGRALRLNEDLIEAIALGHDIGHVPFGHVGEAYLNKLSIKHNEGIFMHNVQSVRTLMMIEDNGKGKNLCLQTLDGILCHNGEFVQEKYMPKKKTKEEFLEEYENCYKDISYIKKLIPMTLEGCVVRISDIIAYLGRDIEDAVRLGMFDINNIPESLKTVLGNSNKDIISTIVEDIIENSLNKNYIQMSSSVYKAIKDLKDFNYTNIYAKAYTEEEKENIEEMFTVVFECLYNSLINNDINDNIFTVYLNDMVDEYINSTTDARKVIDYISGMTDDYFVKEYKRCLKK